MIRLNYIIRMILAAQLLVACNDWLDVTPTTEVRVQDNFLSTAGFFEQLNGVYIAMAQENLYGQHLMFGDIELLARNHYPNNILFGDGLIEYDYNDPVTILRYEAYWTDLYNAISNVNLILDNIDAKASLFTEDDFNIVKGEALALRAFLHFDVFRLFADYSETENLDKQQIPYYESAEILRYGHLPGQAVYEEIIADLDMAEKLLEASDPLIGHYTGILFDTETRVYHLNYYALQALKARVYITSGDKQRALEYANKVINEAPWVWTTPEQAQDGDVLFSSEVLWALNASRLQDTNDEVFHVNSETQNYTTATTGYNGADEIYDTGSPSGSADSRYLYTLGPDNNDWFLHSTSLKYDQEDIYEYTVVPMLRITEMMLTAAEAALDDDRTVAIDLLDGIRFQRDVRLRDWSGVFTNEILEEIVWEYRKELFMEGQLFFIYKRLGYTQIPDGESFGGKIEIVPENYIMPIPLAELELGNRTTD